MSKAHLLVWNPENYPELLQDYENWIAGKLPKDSWSIGRSKSIEVGTRVFLMRVKVEPKGIIAMGEAVSEGFVRPHYSDPRKAENAAYVSWKSFAHPDHPALSLDDLLVIDGRTGLWTPPGAIPISQDNIAEKLEAAWAKAVKRAGLVRRRDEGGTPEESDRPHLMLIMNAEELAENFRTFQRDARRYPSRRLSILRATTYWLRDANSGAFGPGKFLGYQGMDFGLYELARSVDSTGVEFQGKLSRQAIEKVVGEKFAVHRALAAELQEWGARMFGAGAFGGASSSKWRFLTFDIPGREVLTDYPGEIVHPETYYEGVSRTVSVNVYERDRNARAKCIAHYRAVCAVCELDFVARYGQIGKGFIHVHHLRPLSEIGEGYRVDPILDLQPVCPNCHAMLHRKTPCLTIGALKRLLRK